jgi:hypothetical protein
MKIKSGQKLWVKQDFIIDEDPPGIPQYKHKMNDVCIVTGLYKDQVKYPVCVEFDGSEENYSYAEIEKYFYDKAEWREQQINSILND